MTRFLDRPHGGPFDPDDDAAYRRWRAWKLAGYPAAVEELVVMVADPHAPGEAELTALLTRCRKCNMALYRGEPERINDKQAVRALAARFGLSHLDSNLCADDDGITSLRVVEGGRRGGYIPYSNRPINWHSDGYYNPLDQQIRAMLLHCVRPAAEGGENLLLDQEIAYLLLRDADPGYIRALMHPEAMLIPPNEEEGAERPAQGGPVFMVDEHGTLHMRYTARKRNIHWRDDPATREAVAALEGLLGGDSPFIFRHTLASGEGYLCNNVLHTRTGFHDEGEGRLLFRARYHDRIGGTHLNEIYTP